MWTRGQPRRRRGGWPVPGRDRAATAPPAGTNRVGVPATSTGEIDKNENPIKELLRPEVFQNPKHLAQCGSRRVEQVDGRTFRGLARRFSEPGIDRLDQLRSMKVATKMTFVWTENTQQQAKSSKTNGTTIKTHFHELKHLKKKQNGDDIDTQVGVDQLSNRSDNVNDNNNWINLTGNKKPILTRDN